MQNDRYAIDSHKLHLHPERVAQWLDAGTDWERLKRVYPLYVEISPAGGCNHRCTFCAVDYIGYQKRYLDRSALRHCLADMALHGVKSVMYAGEGEPLLAPGLAEMIRFTKQSRIDVAVTTNATALTAKFTRECLKDVTWIKASINAGTPNVYAAIHQCPPGHFDLALNNLAAAVRLRNENGWQTTIGAQAVLLPENAATIPTLARCCRNVGLDYLVVKPYSQNPASNGTAARYGELDYDFAAGLENELAQFDTDRFQVIYRSQTMAHLDEPERAYQACNATPFFWAYIMATGDVYGCSAHLTDERFRYGNINEQSFSEIWEGERRRQCVEYVRHGLDISTCRKNCRMEHGNRHLWRLTNPQPHDAFV